MTVSADLSIAQPQTSASQKVPTVNSSEKTRTAAAPALGALSNANKTMTSASFKAHASEESSPEEVKAAMARLAKTTKGHDFIDEDGKWNGWD